MTGKFSWGKISAPMRVNDSAKSSTTETTATIMVIGRRRANIVGFIVHQLSHFENDLRHHNNMGQTPQLGKLHQGSGSLQSKNWNGLASQPTQSTDQASFHELV